MVSTRIQGHSQDWYWGGGPKVANVSAGCMPSEIVHVVMVLPGWGGVGWGGGGGFWATKTPPEYAMLVSSSLRMSNLSVELCQMIYI